MLMGNRRVGSRTDLEQVMSRYIAEQKRKKFQLLLCSGAGCVSSGCQNVKKALFKALDEAGLSSTVAVYETGCIGSCDIGPTLLVQPGGTFYVRLKPEDMARLVSRHLQNGLVVEPLCYQDKTTGKRIPKFDDIEYFKRQTRVVTARCGLVPYASLEAYIATGGYFALARTVQEMNPQEVVDEMKSSGLRGRGGAGFPTGIKWQAGRDAEGDQKYVVCNADEGDPGAFMDRSVLEGDPHAVLEGMAIAGYAIGASKGFVYVRAEYPLAVERLSVAIQQAREEGLLGPSVLGTEFAFDVEIRIGAGAFVCGEETALMASIEGQRGEPRQKPPFPFQRGVFGKPTIINNVETFANVPVILLHGAEWYTRLGTEKSRGTKVFALAGDVNNAGIVEVPMGMSLGQIVFDIAGGMAKGKKFKAAQTGGPSGGCLTKAHLDTPVDFDSLTELGTIMGSGGLIAMDEDTCMVDVARFFLDFVQDESCGKCVPCRIGTKRMLEVLERITHGHGRPGDVELLEELAEVCKETATCGLGQTAGNPVLSTIRNFREEFDEHILHKYCRAGVCSDMFLSPCQNACPAGVNVPGYIALIAAGRPRDAYNLVRKENPFPAICGRVCTHPCESKCRRTQLDEPIAICDLKRYAADYVLNNEAPYLDLVFPRRAESVGIVGAGPSGLTCAYYLARLGYDVTVYEAEKVAGGMLAYGIPEYRLPKAVLDHEINQIKNVGAKILCAIEVGRDVTFEELRRRFNAVYVATGTQFSNRIEVPGETLEGVYHGLDFLRDQSLGREVTVGKNVVVIGGGSTAFDAARTALRLGAAKVSVVYRRLIEDMPADVREIKEAAEEGIEILPLLAPVEIVGENGSVTGIRLQKMQIEGFDGGGRRRPRAVPNSDFVMECDMVIPAVSQHFDLPFVENKDEIKLSQWGTLIVDPVTRMTSMKGVFGGGDAVRGPDVVIQAIADGKEAARQIDLFLGGKGELNKGEPIEIPRPTAEQSEVVEHERFPMRFLDPDTRRQDFAEVAAGFHRLNAIAEAMRCLRCDLR